MKAEELYRICMTEGGEIHNEPIDGLPPRVANTLKRAFRYDAEKEDWVLATYFDPVTRKFDRAKILADVKSGDIMLVRNFGRKSLMIVCIWLAEGEGGVS